MKKIKIITSSILSIVSIALIVSSFFVVGWTQTLLLSLGCSVAANIAFYLVLTSTIERIEHQKEKQQEFLNEQKSIKRFSKQIFNRLEIVRIEFNELTGPYLINPKEFKNTNGYNDVAIKNMRYMFASSFYTFSKMQTTIIEAYYISYLSLVELCEKLLFSVDLKYHDKLKCTLEKISFNRIIPSGAETLIAFAKNELNPKIKSILEDMMKKYDGNIEEGISTNKFSGNLFLSVAQLYSHLVDNKELFIELGNNLFEILDKK